MDVFHVQVEDQHGSAVVRVVGEIDGAAERDFTAALHAACTRADNRSVIVDLSDVSYCDSSGIYVLLNAHRDAKAKDIRMHIIAASPRVRRLFQLAGVTELLELTAADGSL